MGAGILLSGADDIDFMIHGVFQYELFGQKLWITTRSEEHTSELQSQR